MPASDVRRLVGRRRFDAYTKLSSVRNPFDRMVSSFHFRMSERGESFDDFAQIRARFRRFVLERDWDADADIVSIDGRLIVDRFIRFEHLDEDLRAACEGLGLPFDPALLGHEKNMASSRKRYPVADYYDPETIANVRHRLSWVFENFDYPQNPGEPVTHGREAGLTG
jgi:hypothetical protein